MIRDANHRKIWASRLYGLACNFLCCRREKDPQHVNVAVAVNIESGRVRKEITGASPGNDPRSAPQACTI